MCYYVGADDLQREKGKTVRYSVERMQLADVPKVIEIERLSYPSPWPTSAYRRELQENKIAHYIVIRDKKILEEQSVAARQAEPERPRWLFPLPFLTSKLASPPYSAALNSIVGFAGLWLMVDEAHITTIAVQPDRRQLGLGEFLLINLIDVSSRIGAKWVTLEVRVSNRPAQNLYRKYGFREAGLRHRYYSDNHEDALIMWTEEISSPSFQERFLSLKTSLYSRIEGEELNTPGHSSTSSSGS